MNANNSIYCIISFFQQIQNPKKSLIPYSLMDQNSIAITEFSQSGCTKQDVIEFFERIIHRDENIREIIGFKIGEKEFNRHIFEEMDEYTTFIQIAHKARIQNSQRVIGIAMGIQRIWKKGKKEGWIKFIVVEPSYRGKGIGSSLLNAVEQKLKENGAINLTFGSSSPLYLTPGLPKSFNEALKFFLHHNWKHTSERTNLILDLTTISMDSIKNRLDDLAKIFPDIVIKTSEDIPKDNLELFITNEFSFSWAKELEPAYSTTSPKNFVLILIEKSSNRIIGFVGIGATNPNWLGPMGVKEEFRGKNLGKFLFLETCKKCLEVGIEKLIIPWVNEDNIKFYNGVIGAKIHTKFWKMTKKL